jgi:hypothetical protein
MAFQQTPGGLRFLRPVDLERVDEKSKVRASGNKTAQAQKNIPLISNNLHKFAKIFFSRRRPF